jgi:N-acetylmuramoyl-L-alanine amidase
MYSLSQHRLQGPRVEQRPSPNVNAGRRIVPRFLVFHYTVIDFDATCRSFLSPASQVSAHLLVARDGRVVQFVDFDRRAWHAGQSQWQGLPDLNSHSIGIEVENLGWLHKRATGRFESSNGVPVEPDDVVEARHKHPQHPQRWWQAYPEPQLAVCAELARVLGREYGLQEVLGHDDIAPQRKADPGPAFPLTRMAAAGLGRESPEQPGGPDMPIPPDDAGTGVPLRVRVERLNLRAGPGKEHERLGSVLLLGHRLRLLQAAGDWARVRTVEAQPRVGWVWAAFVEPAPA